ncbi:MAG: glycosyltransferase family 4 protein [Deltaproteobacteria bacterium]|nr:glycosyltransferase family 4 protein [Deltaproteobacteria bacterium]
MPRIGLDARYLRNGGIGRCISALLTAYPKLVRNEEMVILAHPEDLSEIRGRAPTFEVAAVRSRVYSLREHFEIARVVKRLKLDLLHLPHYVVPRGIPCPLVVTVNDLIHCQLPRTRWHSRYCRWMLGQVRAQARLVLTLSKAVARDVEEVAGVEPARIKVIPPAVAEGWTAPSSGPEVEAFLRRLRIELPYVLNVTNGLPHKGLDLLLEALQELPGIRLVLAGQGSDRPEVLRQVEASGLSGSVLVLGALSDRELRLAYASARAVVVASRQEGFGLPALEGMAAGVPVATSDAGGLPEVVGDGAILFRSGSVAELRRALYTVAVELEGGDRAGLIQRGLAQSRKFSWDATARATLAAYERALTSAA